MGDHILSANPAGYADDIRADTVGILAVAQMGRCLGQMDDQVSDGAFLWRDVILRGRYLTVHFYGAMLYFVGFYVLLLFDIVLCIQVENLTAITASEQTMAAYLQNSFFSAGYLMAASIVALKCLNLVPDLAAWMIPEGDTAFSTRNFGEGVAQQAKMSATGAMHSLMR